MTRESSSIDRRSMLADEPFTYSLQKDGSMRICWNSRPVKTVSPAEAGRLLARIANAAPQAVQLVLAKATGNFKRGNEKLAKQKSKL